MHKTIEAYYKNGKIIYTDAMPKIKSARLLITIIEEKKTGSSGLARFRGIFKKKVDGLAYQNMIRSEWS